MKSLALMLLFIRVSYCQLQLNDFNERFWICSLKLLYYTQAEISGHEVISPFGIWTLMTGIACGATGNSYNQLARAFNLPENQNTLVRGYKDLTNAVLGQGDNGVSLASRNFVFLDNDFSVYQDFRRALQNDFGASLMVLDFDDPKSARIANTYIENSGCEFGQVSNVLRSDDFRESRMILTNVISFKGLWASPFNKCDTELEPFYNEDMKKAGTVNMMSQIGQFAYLDMDAIKSFVVELPYGTNYKYSMIVILPYPSVRIAEMYKNIHQVSLKDIFKRLQANGMGDVYVKLPRFHISTKLLLNKPLYDMGVYDIFQPDLASFQRVSKDKMFVSVVVQKADIEVTESGTVASAVTTATFSDRSFAPLFHANRPFMYFIMEKTTTTVIFNGIYSKPTIY